MTDIEANSRYHEALDAERRKQLERWSDVEKTLREQADGDVPLVRWGQERERFYEAHGPIPVSRADRDKLAELKDRYRGERIFVLGNGPSLNDTPLHLLADEFTFGVNRIYLLFDRLRWKPTFYTAVDWRVTIDCADEINQLDGMHRFFPERFRGALRDGDDVTWYWNGPSPDPTQKRFATDASLGIRGAGSVTGAAIQLAFHMGFDPIYLLGCDLSYRIPESVIQEGPDRFGNGVGLYLTSTRDDDANHFDPSYFGAGRRWHDPNVKRMIQGFKQCRDGIGAAGRRIFNATVGGQLEVFERVDVRTLFNRSPRRRAPERESRPPERATSMTPDRARVRPSVLLLAHLDRGAPGLVLDVGAGSGADSAVFAAAGWEVRAFEPDPATFDALVAALPPHWPVFVDPRALGGVSDEAKLFRSPLGGATLAPGDPDSDSHAVAHVVTPEAALQALNGARTPDVLLVSAFASELEILRSYPFDSARPEAVAVAVDDSFAQRLGYEGRDVGRLLETHGYDVFALEDRRVGDEAEQAICRLEDHKGTLTHVIGLAPGAATVESLERCRRAALAARLDATTEVYLDPPWQGGRSGQSDDQSSARRPPTDRAAILGEARTLRWFHSIDFGDFVSPKRESESAYANGTLRPIWAFLEHTAVNDARCLDIGTADGIVAFTLERMGAAEVVATDGAPRRTFEVARQLLGSQVAYEAHLPDTQIEDRFEHHSFDLIIMAGFLYHVFSPLAAIAQARRLLKPDGLLMVETVYAGGDDPAMYLNPAFDHPPLLQWSTYWLPTLPAMENMLRLCCLDVVASASNAKRAAAGATRRVGYLARAVRTSDVRDRPQQMITVHNSTAATPNVDYNGLDRSSGAHQRSTAVYDGFRGHRTLEATWQPHWNVLQPQRESSLGRSDLT